MKKINILLFIIMIFFTISCEYDNYDPPSSKLSAPILYDNDTLYVNNMVLELWQKGYPGNSPISLDVSNQGVFNALLFEGTYYITPVQAVYPFIWEDFEQYEDGSFDTIRLDLKGDAELPLQITPYYAIENFTAELINDSTVQVDFDVDQVITDSEVSVNRAWIHFQGGILINRGTTGLIRENIRDPNEHITVTIDLKDYYDEYYPNSRPYIFVRAGIETSQSRFSLIWSKTLELSLPEDWYKRYI